MKAKVTIVAAMLSGAMSIGFGSVVAHADPYLPHVPGLPGVGGMDIGVPPPGHINQWLPPPGQVKHWVPGPEDFVPNWH